jgi:5-methylcytosine-specific restriction protein A
MPTSPPKRCQHYRCNAPAMSGESYCQSHYVPRHERDHREPAHLRGYDNDWGKLRRAFLRANPLCSVCGRPAQVAHHIVPIDEGGERLDESNLSSMCRACHERLHGRKE